MPQRRRSGPALHACPHPHPQPRAKLPLPLPAHDLRPPKAHLSPPTYYPNPPQPTPHHHTHILPAHTYLLPAHHQRPSTGNRPALQRGTHVHTSHTYPPPPPHLFPAHDQRPSTGYDLPCAAVHSPYGPAIVVQDHPAGGALPRDSLSAGGEGRNTRHTGLPLSYRTTLPVALSHVTAWEGRGEADRSLSELTRDLKTGNGPLSHMEHR